jgi:hypothetical protein
MEAKTTIHMEGMDISTTEEMATRDTTITTLGEEMSITIEAAMAGTRMTSSGRILAWWGATSATSSTRMGIMQLIALRRTMEKAKSIPEGACESCQHGGSP